MESSDAVLVPWFETQKGPLPPNDTPQGPFSFGSVTRAILEMSETRLDRM
jgi:hypothetical protein